LLGRRGDNAGFGGNDAPSARQQESQSPATAGIGPDVADDLPF
jgi:hypothetical protein